jgi:cytoskeleton protein RodZ
MSDTSSLGAYLRELRTRRGLSLDELARLTRVASRYLEALEGDQVGALPAPVFSRGYIRAYCQALHEPVEEALALYEGQSGRTSPTAPARSPSAAPPAEREARSRSTVLVSFVLLVVLGLALFGVTLALQSGRETTGKRTAVDTNVSPSSNPLSASAAGQTNVESDPPAPRTPATSDVGVAPRVSPPPSAASIPTPSVPRTPVTSDAVATPRVTPPPPAASVPTPPAPRTPATSDVVAAPRVTPLPPAASAPTAPATPPLVASAPVPATPPSSPDLSGVVAAVTSPYRLVARVSEPTWIRVRTEDGRLSEETIPAGQVREWVSNGPFVLTIGNAGGVSFELNGRLLPALGPSGTVISRLVLPPQQ